MQVSTNKSRRSSAFLIRVFLFVLLTLTIVSASYAEEALIRILHVNDFHGYAEPHMLYGSKRMVGGAAYLAAAVHRLRNERPALLLAAGDMIQGNSWANVSQGESVIEIMNVLKFDAMVVGNHEFDFGQDILKKRISQANFPVLAANVAGIEGTEPYIVKEVSGIKIGILGVVTEDTPFTTNLKDVIGLKFISPKETVEKYLPGLRNRSDIVIVLSHIGHHADRLLAEEVKGIDAIIGGHSHTKVDDPPFIGRTIILQAWEHGKALGVLDITYENGRVKSTRGRLEDIKPSDGMADKTAEAIVLKHKAIVDSVLDQKIGEADTDLDGENVRRRETNLGNLIADIIREVSRADAALINSGSIRTSIHTGEIKTKDIYSALPFDNYIVAMKLRGRQIHDVLEHAVAAVEKGSGAFPQVSGIHFRYDLASPPGSRIKEIRIAATPLDPESEYIVATTDFIASGGDGYKAFGDVIKSSRDYSVIGGAMKGENLVFSDPSRWLRDIVIEYVRSHKKINSKVEGRMVQVGK